MEIKRFDSLHPHAMTVRNTVFVEEQGFVDEFDDTDKIAIHLVMYDGDTPVGVCRVFRDKEENAWLLGRFAILREYRGKSNGSALLAMAEAVVRREGGRNWCPIRQWSRSSCRMHRAFSSDIRSLRQRPFPSYRDEEAGARRQMPRP